MPITAVSPFSQLSRSMRRQESVSSDAVSGLELAYLRNSVDGFDNHRSAVDDYNETMQEPKSFFVLPDSQKLPPSTAGTSINASFSASPLGPDPYAYTPPNPVTGEGVNKTFVIPSDTSSKQGSSSSNKEDKAANFDRDTRSTQSSDSRIPIDSNTSAANDGPNTLQAQEQTTSDSSNTFSRENATQEKTMSTPQNEVPSIQSSEVRNPYEALTTLDKPNLHTEERQQQTLKPFDAKSAEQTSSKISGDKGSPSTPSEEVGPNPVSNSEPISPAANAGTTTFYPDGKSSFTPSSPFSNPSEAYYRDSSTSETTTPNYKRTEAPEEDAPRNATIRAKEFWQGVGQGAKSLISLPGLSILGGSLLLGALFPWAVPFLTIAGVGFGLFYVVGGMASDDWSMVGRGAFNLLGSAIFGKVMSDIFPIGGHDGFRYALPGRSVEPLRFYPADPFGHVNNWYVSGVNQPYYIWGSQISGSAAPIPPAGMSFEDMEFATPSDLMLAASNHNRQGSDSKEADTNKADNAPLQVAAAASPESSNPFSIYTIDHGSSDKTDASASSNLSETDDNKSDGGWYADLSYGVDSSDSSSSARDNSDTDSEGTSNSSSSTSSGDDSVGGGGDSSGSGSESA